MISIRAMQPPRSGIDVSTNAGSNARTSPDLPDQQNPLAGRSRAKGVLPPNRKVRRITGFHIGLIDGVEPSDIALPVLGQMPASRWSPPSVSVLSVQNALLFAVASLGFISFTEQRRARSCEQFRVVHDDIF
jgi:hypothetical protein